jgi:diguanylate cyclase (GGDEF)-like protein
MEVEPGTVAPPAPEVLPRRRWPLVALVLVVVAGETTSVLSGQARPWILGVSVLVLDVLGIAYGWAAARRSVTVAGSWRLLAAGRAASLGANIGLTIHALSGVLAWWWVGTVAQLLMYALLAAGVLIGATHYLYGRARRALLAEITTVLAAGFMLIWYLVLEPILDNEHSSYVWVSTIGAPLGDLLLIAAVAAVLLRGARIRISAPGTILVAGLACYLISDVTWAAVGLDGEAAAGSLFASMSVVVALLLLTIAPMMEVHRPRLSQARTAATPLWAGHLPVAAMMVGCTLMLVVTLREHQMLPWGGLVCGLIVMTCAVSARQVISVRDSRDLILVDPLTGLASRTGFERGIERTLKRREPIALLLIDLDGFKQINDAYGHAAGDTVLTEFAHQLVSVIRAGQTASRIGGDEFAVVLTDTTVAADAASVARRILAAVAASPVRLDDDTVPVRASIGVALTQADDTTKDLLRRADLAMYHSKRAGTHACTVYDPSMVDRRGADAALSDNLDGALDRGELHLLYQPIVDLTDNRPIAAEALLRWKHATLGLVSPVQFIPIAERSGAITRIGLWVLEQALRQLRRFQDGAPSDRPMHISVNLSPRQLQEPTIVHDVLAALERTGVDPHHLVLEITESAIVDESSGINALRALRTHGIRIAIDDFGTGYSSLQYLTRLPVDLLKIDRSFVAELNSTPEGAAVTEAIIRLSQVLHLTTVAEGIETPEQAAELQMLGCDTGQGYLFARPLPAAELATMLTRIDVDGRR